MVPEPGETVAVASAERKCWFSVPGGRWSRQGFPRASDRGDGFLPRRPRYV